VAIGHTFPIASLYVLLPLLWEVRVEEGGERGERVLWVTLLVNVRGLKQRLSQSSCIRSFLVSFQSPEEKITYFCHMDASRLMGGVVVQ
jgi:hypothetical protein